MGDRFGVALAPSAALWPPDDTEESVLGTNLHQTAIIALRTGINEAAALATPEGAAVLWQAGGQTMVRDFRRPNGTSYTTLPDVFVYRKPWDDARGSLRVTTDGPPALIIEVLSEVTYQADLNLERGKGYSYARAGVAEYLLLDPAYRFAPDGGVGWRLAEGEYQPWRRESDGRWRSAVLPLAFGLEGARAAVYAADGHRILREGEVERTLRRERTANERRLQEYAAEVEQLRRRLAEVERGR
jgi:hypothetical protein